MRWWIKLVVSCRSVLIMQVHVKYIITECRSSRHLIRSAVLSDSVLYCMYLCPAAHPEIVRYRLTTVASSVRWTLDYPNSLGPIPVHLCEMFIYVKYSPCMKLPT